MIDKMLAKDPKLRYADCDELIRDLSGLQLDSPSLSFIDDPEAVVITRKPGVARGPQTAAAQAKGENKPAKAPEQDMWYIQHRNSKGQPTISRMDTEGVRKALKAGMLDSQAKAARTKDGDYIPLTQYAQFAAESHAVALKEQADKLGRKNMSQLYDEIDKDEKRKKRWRWFKQRIEGVGGFVQLLLYLAVLAAVGYGLYWAYNQYLAEHFTKFMDKIQN
jgi:serine/threonine-protein kinase